MNNFEKKENKMENKDQNNSFLFGIFGNSQETKTEPQNKTEVDPETQPEPKPEPESEPKPESEIETETKTETESPKIKEYCIAVVDELSFKKEVNGIKTDENINVLFKNEKFMFLKTEQNEMVDIPIVSYNVNIIEIDEKKELEFSKNTILEPLFFDTPVGKRIIFSNPKEFNREYQKFVVFIGNAIMILNNENILIDKTDKKYNEYENEEIIIISDLNNNSYYLIKSIVDFVKVPI